MRTLIPGLPALALSLMLAAAPGLAQPPADPAPEPEPQAPGEARSGEDAPAQEPDSPFEYEASEQISEDLSVSFPVDI